MPNLLTLQNGILYNTLIFLVLSYSATSCLLLGGRITEMIAYYISFWAEPTKINVNKLNEQPHRANTTILPYVSTLPIFPGMILFFAGITGSFLKPVDPFYALHTTTSPTSTYGLLWLSILAVSIAFPLRPSVKLKTDYHYRIMKILDIFYPLSVVAYIWFTEISIQQALSILFVTRSLTSITLIIFNSVLMYGLLFPIFLPFALLGWTMRVISFAFLGPIVFLLPTQTTGIFKDWLSAVSLARQNQITNGRSRIDLNTAIDSVRAAQRPF